ncbi:nuclear transport factor 2 family protein [Methylocapsa sp. S129]|uniref:nuclear transport factor 2 family protein n=1 Tax=Methylocapsa sp. S129 TaxID=1641869 RepID=UPI00131B87B5|nr:nuclear transport factor 2 family protein [Methylocapsa sp. S129]
MDKDAFEERWNAYFAAYATTDEAERQRLLERCVSDDLVFTNPGGEGKGRASLHAHIGNFQKHMPGATFSTDRLLVHHGELLAVWSLHKQDGTKVSTGYNFVRPDKLGLFSYMAGFF